MPLIMNSLAGTFQTGNLSCQMFSSKYENGISVGACIGATTE